MPKLIAKERFFYAGRNVEAGAGFEAQPQDVALLTNSISPRARPHDGSAPPAAPVQTRTMFPVGDEQHEELPTAKRKYNRRDMRAKE